MINYKNIIFIKTKIIYILLNWAFIQNYIYKYILIIPSDIL